MPKGDFYGPDKYRGVRPTGKDKYYGPNKHRGRVPDKKKNPGSGNTKPPKANKYEVEADKLAEKQYAGVLTELKMGRDAGKANYDQQRTRRAAALENELKSNTTAGQITENTVVGLKGQALAQYAKDMATQKALSEARTSAENAVNTDALTQYQEQMKARGIDPGKMEDLTSAMKTRQGFSGELDRISGDALTRSENLARQLYDTQQIQVKGQTNRYQAQAATAADTDNTAAYQTYANKDAELAGTLAKTKLDQGSTAAQTALTLKKEAELRKQEKAQLALERHIAGLKNSQEMAKVASSDYFKEAGLKLKQADMNLKGKALDARISKYKRDGDLGEAKLLETMRNNLAKNRIAETKAGISYKAPTGPRGN